MMSNEIKEFSRDEASSFIFNAGPSQGSMVPAQQAATQSAPVAPVAPPSLTMPSKGRPAAAIPDPTELIKVVSKADKNLKEEAPPPEPPSAISGLVNQITDNWKPIAITAAATYAATKAIPVIGEAVKSAYSQMKNRNVGAPVESTRIDPVFADANEMLQAEAASQKPGPTLNPLENLQQRANDLRAAVQGNAPIVPPQFSPAGIPAGDIPPAPPYLPSTPFSAAPPDAPAPESSAGPNSSTTSIVNNTVKEMIDEVDKNPPQGIYRDPAGNLVYPKEMSPGARAGAEAFAQQYPEQAAALEAEKRFAILGAGAADNNLFNAYGAELRKEILKEVNQGQPAGVSSNYTERINPAIKAISPESVLGKQLQDLRANEPKSAVRGRLGTPAAVTPTGLVQGSKIAEALKNAGKISLVMAMTDAANAATQGDYTGAAKIAGPALDPTGILEAAINPQSTARNITNVSPIFGFFSQLIANQADERAKQAYIEKVGGGRGLTPASAYRR